MAAQEGLHAAFGCRILGDYEPKMRIQISETTYKLLEHKYLFQERGIIEFKGKGEMKIYLLIGKK